MIRYLDEMEAHFEKWYPREGCGLLGVQRGKLKWVPCDNVAEEIDDFVMDSRQYLKVIKSMDIIAIVHSHPEYSCEPSTTDINNCNAIGIPYYIFSYPSMEMYDLTPKNYSSKPLIGRTYEFGVSDCYEAARDYYKEKTNIEVPKRIPYENNWWDRGIDYFNEEYINSFGSKRVNNRLEAEKNDLMVFSVESDIPNHCGVYIGDNLFFHHAEHRLSCRDYIGRIWLKALTGVYRYEA